jgi:hypothetical protein
MIKEDFMKKFFKMTMVLVFFAGVSGTALAGNPPHKPNGKGPVSHHNSHRPGPASNEKPGGHAQNLPNNPKNQ